MKTIFSQVRDFLLKPFRENLEVMLILCLLVGAADGYFWTIHAIGKPEISPAFGAYMFIHSAVLTYGIVLLLGLFRDTAQKCIRCIVYILGFINLCIDTGVHVIMKCGFISDFVAIIMGTNTNETKEFLGMYINSDMILFIALVSLIAIGIHLLFKKKRIYPSIRFAATCVSLILLSSLLLIARKSKNWDGVFLMKIVTCLKYKPTPDLHEFSKTYNLTTNSSLPTDVVLILGESLNKSHMSIYGYDKKTTPLLDSLNCTGRLFPFDGVKSSGIGTIPAFRFMMTSMTREDEEMDWNKKFFLTDIIKSAGYDIRWISNQASAGIHDNIVARFAELSDSVIWCGTKFVGPSKTDLDEVVLEPTQSRLSGSGEHRFTVVHLCGNHENFRSRYSSDFERFSVEDYTTKPEGQRQILSEYDNSVVYNDWIVTSIMGMMDGHDAVVFYLPDHSLDIFDSSDDYAGHARGNDPTSIAAGKNIPFLIYLTNKFSEGHPELEERLKSSLHNDFESENLTYAIMDVLGLDFVGDRQGAVKQYSLLSQDNQ
ncbi:MAG: phosphoethanolamine transferase [Bacteroidales bacterium]|nr:phosphoethanolamine transferase [Candidatus Cryptobacteroides onthequi]